MEEEAAGVPAFVIEDDDCCWFVEDMEVKPREDRDRDRDGDREDGRLLNDVCCARNMVLSLDGDLLLLFDVDDEDFCFLGVALYSSSGI